VVQRNEITSKPIGIPVKSTPLWAKNANSYPSNLPAMDAAITEEAVIDDNKATAETPTSTLERKSTNPTPVLFSLAQKISQKMTQEPTMAVSAFALALVLMLSPTSATAAMSGGRMGGSFPSQRSSPSRSMRPSSSRSYGGGYSRGPSYSRGFQSGYGSGLGTSYMSRPNVAISPFYSPFSPFGFPRPTYFGGPGAIVYNRGPSLLDLAVFGGIAFTVVNTIRNAADGNTLTSWDEQTTSFWGDDAATSALGSGTSTVQISVAMEVPNRSDPNSILSVLDRLSRTAKTDSRVGIQNLSSQVALELLRRKSSIVSASSRYKHFGDRNKAQRDFNELSIKERGKFEQETSRYGGVDYSDGSGRQSSPSDSKATMAVITIMLAIDGDSTKVGTMNSIQDVEDALRKIAANVKINDCLQGSEILWTPEDQRETLSLREVVADYPELRTV
jgi:uncharacterized membrane protein